MSQRVSKLEELGYPIDKINPGGNVILPLIIDNKTVYVSGQVPYDGAELVSKGKVPSQGDIESAGKAAHPVTRMGWIWNTGKP